MKGFVIGFRINIQPSVSAALTLPDRRAFIFVETEQRIQSSLPSSAAAAAAAVAVAAAAAAAAGALISDRN